MQISSSLYGVSATLATRSAIGADSGSNGAGFASLLLQQNQGVPPATPVAPPPPSPPQSQSSAPPPAAAPAEAPARTPSPATNAIASKASAARALTSTPKKAAPEAKAAQDDALADAAGRTTAGGAAPPTALDAETRASLRSKLRAADGAPPAEEGVADKSEVATSAPAATTEKQKRGATRGNDGNGIDPSLNPSTMVQSFPLQAVATRSGDPGGGQAQNADGDGDGSADTSTPGFADAARSATAAQIDAKREANATTATPSTDAATPIAGGSFDALLAARREADSASATRGAAVDRAAPVTANASAFAPAPAAGTAAPTAVDLPTPVNAPDFAQQLGVQVSVLTQDGVQRAELHLNPADMGPVSVAITLDGTQARIDFGADVAATRHAIETGMPALASALADAGFTLAGGGVSQHAGGGGQGNSGSGAASDSGRRAAAVDATNSASGAPSRMLQRTVSAGGVDLYA